jgi:hypothetical protein
MTFDLTIFDLCPCSHDLDIAANRPGLPDPGSHSDGSDHDVWLHGDWSSVHRRLERAVRVRGVLPYLESVRGSSRPEEEEIQN